MNKYIFIPLIVSLALFSCKKEAENPYEGEELPTVSMTSEASSFSADEAELLFTLSHFIHKDVVVTFAISGIEADAVTIPTSFTIPAGTVKQKLTVGIDETVPAPGSYDVQIALASAENASISSEKEVRLSETVNDLGLVTLSGSPFTDGSAVIRVHLHKKLTKPATLTLVQVTDDDNRYPLMPADAATFSKSVTVPAGEKMVEIPVTTDMSKLAYGLNQLKISAEGLSSNLSFAGEAALLDCRVPIVLNERTDWNWGYDNSSQQYYAYNNGLSGTDNIAVLSFSKPTAGLTDAYLEEQIYQFVTALTDQYYSTSGWDKSYIWMAKQVFEPGEYIAALVGLDSHLSPTGDYSIVEVVVNEGENPETLEITKTDWSFIYYSGWFYVYKTGVKFGLWTVPGDYDLDDAMVVTSLLKQYEAGLKAAGGPTFKTSGTSTAAFSCWELSAAGYTSAPYYSWNQENSSTSSYKCIMIGLDGTGAVTGEYNYITFDWT